MLVGMPTDTDSNFKVQQNRVRRMADRQGLRLILSRTRDPRALNYGRCYLVDVATNCVVVGDPDYWYLDDVEDWLKRSGGAAES
jgi:hypothetical protein